MTFPVGRLYQISTKCTICGNGERIVFEPYCRTCLGVDENGDIVYDEDDYDYEDEDED